MPSRQTVDLLLQRFGGATLEMLDRVLSPYRLKVLEIVPSEGKSYPLFRAQVSSDVWTPLEKGTTGKVVPKDHVEGNGAWREIVKGRVLRSLPDYVEGELYFSPGRLRTALSEVKCGDYP